MTAKKGKLIVIEGLEGAGKSTAVHVVIDCLVKKNIQSIVTREPGGTAIGEELRTIIKNPKYSDVMDAKTELLLMYASRIQLIEEQIKPALNNGIWVIADRFELSTLAYQGGGRGLDKAMIEQLSQFFLNGFAPDLTLYLDITPKLGMERAKSRGQFDRIEQQSIEFFQRVHQSYMECIQKIPNLLIVDASRSLDEVQMATRQKMNDFIEHGL